MRFQKKQFIKELDRAFSLLGYCFYIWIMSVFAVLSMRGVSSIGLPSIQTHVIFVVIVYMFIWISYPAIKEAEGKYYEKR